MIVNVSGFGWSGAGAVHDLLREYSDAEFLAVDWRNVDLEFTLLWEPDGIRDLEYKLCQKHNSFGDSNTAIKRFLRLVKAQNKTSFLHYDTQFNGEYEAICRRYIEDLVQFRFKGRTFEEVMYPDMKERVLGCYNQVVARLLGNHIVRNVFHQDLSHHLTHPHLNTIYVSYNPAFFLERTQDLMEELLSYSRRERSFPLITDELFPPDSPQDYFKYIKEPAKCIVVRRDPRDLYLLAKQTYHSEIPIPSETVDDFIMFYKTMIEDTKVNDHESILNIDYEDLIYQYDTTRRRIEEFVGISSHARKHAFFNPQQSINNTQLFHLYDGYDKEIQKIAALLPGSLYPFEKCQQLGKDRHQIF